jgi:copper homeostasis protein
MPGSGVNAKMIQSLLELYPFKAFHMSGKTVVDNGMRFRREGVPMGLPGLDEFSLWLTDAEKVREAVAVLKGAATC